MKDKHPWRDGSWAHGEGYVTRQQVTVWLRRLFRDALMRAGQPGFLDDAGLAEAVISALGAVLTERRRAHDVIQRKRTFDEAMAEIESFS